MPETRTLKAPLPDEPNQSLILNFLSLVTAVKGQFSVPSDTFEKNCGSLPESASVDSDHVKPASQMIF